jgi:hypothetical protein
MLARSYIYIWHIPVGFLYMIYVFRIWIFFVGTHSLLLCPLVNVILILYSPGGRSYLYRSRKMRWNQPKKTLNAHSSVNNRRRAILFRYLFRSKLYLQLCKVHLMLNCERKVGKYAKMSFSDIFLTVWRPVDRSKSTRCRNLIYEKKASENPNNLASYRGINDRYTP